MKPINRAESNLQKGIVGYIVDHKAINLVSIAASTTRYDTIDKIATPDWLALNESDAYLVPLINCLTNLQLYLALFSPRNAEHSWAESDLTATNPVASGPPIIECKGTNGPVLFTYNIKLPVTNWQHSQRISTIPDLADATVWVVVGNCPSELASSLRPISLTLNFDKATVTTTNRFLYEYPDQLKTITVSNLNEFTTAANDIENVRKNHKFKPVFVSKLPSYEQLTLDAWILGNK